MYSDTPEQSTAFAAQVAMPDVFSTQLTPTIVPHTGRRNGNLGLPRWVRPIVWRLARGPFRGMSECFPDAVRGGCSFFTILDLVAPLPKILARSVVVIV
ncbi:MAG: hypothetical protein ACOYOO_13220 [Saprospiraceae bacterium]